MSSLINDLKKRAISSRKTIVLPESMDIRVLSAAEIAAKEKIANVVLIGKREDILKIKSNFCFDNITLIDPIEYENSDILINSLYELRKGKGMTFDQAKDLVLNDYMYFACMLVKMGTADGIVSGACHSSSNTLRPALQIIKQKKDFPLVSSFFIMVVPNCTYGENGIFIFSDCGLVQNPDSDALAAIASSSAESFEYLVGKQAKVAMLSHSTFGSAEHEHVDKVRTAVKIAQKKYSKYLIDGEFQLDAAIVPSVAKDKAPNSIISGKANVLIFPDLDAGNIGYKLVQRLANAEAYGPITQGIASPVNDLSRGCNIEDIVGVIAITAVQASLND